MKKNAPQEKVPYIPGNGSSWLLYLKNNQEMEISKKFLIFSLRKTFLLFLETETLKKIVIFQETKRPYVSRIGTFLYFEKGLLERYDI